MSAFLPTTPTAVLQSLVFSSSRVTVAELAPGGLVACCDYCPRPASHLIDADADADAPTFVCRSHARVAAEAIGEKASSSS